MHGGVPGRLEAVDLRTNSTRSRVGLRVRDDGDPVVHRLDAPRAGTRANAPDDLLRLEIEHDDMALQIGGDEGHRRAAKAGGQRARLRCEGQRPGNGYAEEPSSVHECNTPVGAEK